MATINFNRLQELLDSGELHQSQERTAQLPQKILKIIEQLGFEDSITSDELAARLKINPNTIRMYTRWLAGQGLIWVLNIGQGGRHTIKSINSPW